MHPQTPADLVEGEEILRMPRRGDEQRKAIDAAAWLVALMNAHGKGHAPGEAQARRELRHFGVLVDFADEQPPRTVRSWRDHHA